LVVEYNSVPFFQGTTFRQKRAKTGSFCIPLYNFFLATFLNAEAV
jgi:hypothetical protein